MYNRVKYIGIGLLLLGITACDNNGSKAATTGTSAESRSSSQQINLLDGKLSFLLPVGMSDQSGKLGTQANNMHVYSDSTGQKAIIVIISDKTTDGLETLSKRMEEQQRTRDPQLQVVTNKSLALKGHPAQQLDSIISAKGQTAYSSVILSKVSDKLLTIQITLPTDNQQQAQSTAESIINTVTIK